MIITPADVSLAQFVVEREVEEQLRYDAEIESTGSDYDFEWNFHTPLFFAEAPHLLLPIGFDEFRVVARPPLADRHDWDFLHTTYGLRPDVSAAYEFESLYRDSQSGHWVMFEGLSSGNDRIHFEGSTAIPDRYESVATWLSKLTDLCRQPDTNPHILWVPSSWTPRAQAELSDRLAPSVVPILRALHFGDQALIDVSWRDLEEIVAELLRDSGFQIHVTSRSNDGGRDVVARSFLPDGEPLEIAIEVKQKRVVDLSDVRAALHANRGYPAVMLATTGRYSSGVIRERDLGGESAATLPQGWHSCLSMD